MDLFKSGFLLLFLLHSIESKYCVIDNRPSIDSWEQQLQNDLRKCDTLHLPPDANNTEVVLKFIMKSFYFSIDDEALNINTWLMYFWNDSRLSWNPEDYGGVTEFIVSNLNIWTPKLRLYSSSDVMITEFDDLSMSQCRVNSTGRVSCVPRILYLSVCNSKFSNWPYDIRNCSFRFGPISNRSRTTFTLKSSRVILFGAEYGPGWNIIDHTVNEDPKSRVQFTLNFVLERQGLGIAASVVAPPLVLSAITFMSLFLKVDGENRLGLLCFSLLNQFFFLQVISAEIPNKGVECPTILLYLRSLIIWTLLAIGITLLLQYFIKKSSLPSYFIKVSIHRIFDSYGKYLIRPRWDANIDDDGENDAIKNASFWADFASVTNFVFMVLVAIIFIINFFAYIPLQQS